MTSPLHAPFCADRAIQQTVAVLENQWLARDTYRIRFHCPPIARRIVPGQFVMLRLALCDDPLLGRAFALYDTVLDGEGCPIGLDVVYLVMGKMTAKLAQYRPGQEVEVWGPLGNGFAPEPTDHLVMVGGGIGHTPFLAVAQEYLGTRQYGDPLRRGARAERVTLCYGVRTKDYFAGVANFENLGVEVRLSTDDGTAGHHGLVTEVLSDVLAQAGHYRIVCCGPERMMEAVAHMAAERNVPCHVSLETPMACGLGICFSCVAKVRDATGQWDYRRTCVEGPVFDAARIAW